MKKVFTYSLCVALILTACQSAPPDSSKAAKSVESYLQARVSGNVEQMIGLSCGAWESNARLEAQSIQGRSPKLENLVCETQQVEGDQSTVSCNGKIVTSYDGEQREVDLAKSKFKLIAQGGEWRICGYK
jgi:hypothetical protein